MGNGPVWYFEGIFSTKAKAVSACQNENYFIAAVELDGESKTLPFANAEYPLKGARK